MKNAIKKAISVMLVAVMVFGTAPLAGLVGLELPEINLFSTKAEAATYSGTCGGNLTWTLDTETGELIISGTGAMTTWYSISTTPWYNYRSSIKSVTIPDGVTSIGQYAFYNCTSLASITIPDSVTSIGSDAFNDCTSLENVYYNGDIAGWLGINAANAYSTPFCYVGNLYFGGELVTDVEIPEGITAVRNYAFYGCESLASITIPDSVTTISERAFYNCTSLENVTIGSGLKTVGYCPFGSCEALKNLTVLSDEADLEDILSSSVNDRRTLMIYCNKNSNTHIYAEKNSLAYYLLDGTEEDNTISGTVGTKLSWTIDRKTRTLTIDNKGTMVSFASETAPWILHEEYVVNVKINYGCTNISTEAFYDCDYLENIDIPYSVTSIGSHAFYDCRSLASITIPDSVTTIGEYAFDGCTSLASITIPDSVTTIGKYAFGGCTSLASVTIPDSVTSIGAQAFWGCRSLASVTIPDSVTSIGVQAFGYCTSLASVTIPASVRSIESYAFADCSKLYNIYIYNRNCSIYETSITVHATIHGYKGSTAETFADKYGYEFIPIIDNLCEEHTYENGCDIYCDVCGFKREITHTFDEWIIIKEPTCVSLGTKKHICSVCGYSELDKVEMLTEHVFDNVCDTTCNSCGDIRDITHDYGEWVVTKEPTCGAFGEKEHTCSICGAVETDTVAKLTVHTYTDSCDTDCDICGKIRKINHTYGEWVVTKDPTCGEYGSKEHVCSVCGAVEKYTIAKLTEHTYADTCDTDCDVCGKTREINHTYGEWVVTKEPTCGALGEKEHICSVCGAKETDFVAKLEEHTYTDSCDEGCNICGETRKIEHTYGKWVITKEPTCSDYGVKERVCTVCGNTETGTVDKSDDHVYTDTCDTDCNICGEIRKINHTFGEWTVTKQPTCDEFGFKERVCSVCGHVGTSSVDKTNIHTYSDSCDTDCNICGATRKINHTFGDWNLIKAPTCDAYGVKERICAVCGHREESSVAKLEEHDYTDSCDTSCNICGEIRTISHTYGEWTVTAAPTCSSHGEKERVCTVCSHEEKLTVPMVSEHTFTNSCDTDCNYCGETRLVNHTYGEWVVVQKPNCKYLGVKEQVCTGCGNTKTGSVPRNDVHTFADSCDAECDLCGEVRDVEHSYGEWAVTKQPTCSESGVKERTCSLCGNTETVDVEKLEHTYADSCDTDCDVCGAERTITHTFAEWVVLQAPDCQFLGIKERICSVCGSKQSDYISKTEHIYTNTCDAECDVCGLTREATHSYGDWVITKKSTCGEAGVKERTCSVNGCVEKEGIPALDHTFGEWTVIQEPTCKTLGIKECICSECGYSKTTYVDMLDYHTYTNDCDNDCNFCGELRDVDHTFGEWTVIQEPTCKTLGIKECICSECGCSKTTYVDMLDYHTYTNDCDSDCNFCGEIRKVDHTYGEWTVIQEPTCKTLGVKECICSVCGYSKTTYVDQLDHEFTDDCDSDCDLCGDAREVKHEFGEWVVTKEATCTEAGSKERTCSVSGCVDTETVDIIAHADENDDGICDVCANQFEIKYQMNGVCGQNLTWELDDEGVLTISGSGAMYDFGNSDYISVDPETKEQVTYESEGSIKVCRWNGHLGEIKEVVVSDTVESVSAYAFRGCYNLEKIIVPDTVINIDPSAFDGCGKAAIVCENGSYAHVYAVQNGIKYVLEDNANGAAFEIKNSMLISYNGSASNVVLPAEITSIGIYAFKGNDTAEFIEIPYGVLKIYNGAFANCPNLEGVIIPFTVTEISDAAFAETNAKIYCYNNSYTHNYAVANGIEYELITVTLSVNSADVLLGDMLKVNAVPSITLTSGVPFVWESSDTSVAAVDKNGNITANSTGEATISVLAPDGTALATCEVTVIPDEYKVTWVVDGETTEKVYKVGDAVVAPADPAKTGYKFIGWTPEVPSEMPAYDITFTAVFEALGPVNADILRKPSQTTIKYGDAIILHVDASKIPEGGRVEWKADNGNFKYSANGDTCRIDPNKSGSTTFTATIYDAEGNAIMKDEQTMTSKAGFFDKLIAFFKKLFGATKVIPQVFKGIY